MGHAAAPLVDVLEEDLSQFIGRAGGKTRGDDDKMEQGFKRVVRQTCQAEIGKSPEVTVIVSRFTPRDIGRKAPRVDRSTKIPP